MLVFWYQHINHAWAITPKDCISVVCGLQMKGTEIRTGRSRIDPYLFPPHSKTTLEASGIGFKCFPRINHGTEKSIVQGSIPQILLHHFSKYSGFEDNK